MQYHNHYIKFQIKKNNFVYKYTSRKKVEKSVNAFITK